MWGKKLRNRSPIRGIDGMAPIPTYPQYEVSSFDCNEQFCTRRKFGYIGEFAKWGWGSKMQAVRVQPSAGLQVLQANGCAVLH